MTHTKEDMASDQRFHGVPSMYAEGVACWIIRDGKLAAISALHEGGGDCIYINVEDARLIRDWLIKAIP